jgi:hypothetical protein
MTVPTYAYALNNPQYWYDPDGRGAINWSSKSWWYKPENSDTPVEIPPGKTFFGYQDGVTESGCKGAVYKTSDFVDVLITDDGVYPLPNFPWIFGHWWKGGWKGPEFSRDHPNWAPLSEKGL